MKTTVSSKGQVVLPAEIRRQDGIDAGVLAVDIHPDQVFLRTVALLPEFQGRGIGTEVIRHVMETAAEPAIKLKVPLKVDAKAAGNWEEAH